MLPVIQVPHKSKLVRHIRTAVRVGRSDNVLEHFVLALQHGAVVRSPREERAMDLVTLFYYLTVGRNKVVS